VLNYWAVPIQEPLDWDGEIPTKELPSGGRGERGVLFPWPALPDISTGLPSIGTAPALHSEVRDDEK